MTALPEQEVLDPGNLPPMVVVWETTARPSSMPGHAYAARLLATTVEHLKVAGDHAQERLVPTCADRIKVLLEEAGLEPATVAKTAEQVVRELRVLAAEINADARKTLHRRMAADLAATLIPKLDGGAKQ